jgi:hypothetical protein
MAKKSKNRTGSAGSPDEASGGRSVVWLSGLACGVLAAVAPALATLAAGLLLPGLVALKLDQEPGRPIARTVLTFGLAGCVHPVIILWNTGQSFETAVAIVTDPKMAGAAWIAAAMGWLMTQIAPLVMRAILEATALARAARLRTVRGRLLETWGIEPPPTR